MLGWYFITSFVDIPDEVNQQLFSATVSACAIIMEKGLFTSYGSAIIPRLFCPDCVSCLFFLQGRNLNWACKDSDVTVHIGTGFCNVTSLSLSQLTCKPPKKAPQAIGEDGLPSDDQPPQVVVSSFVDRWH